MTFQGTVLKEQGVTFAIVIVKKHVVDVRSEAEKTIHSFQPVFPGIPIILMTQNTRGIPTYFGRRDIVQFLSNVPLNRIPWKKYTIQ